MDKLSSRNSLRFDFKIPYILSNIKNIKDITINIPKLFSSIDDFGSVLALSPSTSYTISILVSDIQALIQGGIGVLQVKTGFDASNNDTYTHDSKIKRAIENVDSSYKKNFKCEEFAKELANNLDEEGIDYDVIKIESEFGIYSNKLGQSVAQGVNSHHIGIRVGEIVYDNNFSNGVPFYEWLNDFGIGEYKSITYSIIDKSLIP